MPRKQKPKWFVDCCLWDILYFLEKNLEDQYSFRDKCDVLRHVVIGLFEDLGYAEEHLDGDDRLGLIMTDLGERRFIIESGPPGADEEEKNSCDDYVECKDKNDKRNVESAIKVS